MKNVQVLGVRGDPLKINQLRRRIDVTDYKCAIVLCDEAWQDPDLDLSNGLDLVSEADTLRLDALVMTVQLNIRKLLEVDSPSSSCKSPTVFELDAHNLVSCGVTHIMQSQCINQSIMDS